jgi:hypothetical protein
MSEKKLKESESYSVVFEGLDTLDNFITQQEISLVMRYLKDVLDDRVTAAKQQKGDVQ